MAIRNTELGGTDWENGEILEAPDLNDTFDAGTSKIQTLTAFWLNDELYDVYDDFDSYSTGAFTTNAKWDVSTSGGGISGGSGSTNIEIVESQNAGGVGKELYIRAQAQVFSSSGSSRTVDITSLQIPKNVHTFARIRTDVIQSRFASGSVVQTGGYTIDFGFPQDTQHTGLSPRYHRFLAIAKGDDKYDVYVGGRKAGDNITNSTGQWQFKVTAASGSSNGHEWRVYIDDVRVSKSSVE